MGVDDNFAMVKRFDVLHPRYLLHLQSSLAELQKRLDACDDAETIQLNLSSARSDNSEERKLIMNDVEMQLAKYGLDTLVAWCLSGSTRVSSYIDQSLRRRCSTSIFGNVGLARGI